MINMVNIIDTEFPVERAFEKGMLSIDFKSLEDLKKVAVKLKIHFIFKCKDNMGIEHYYFPHQGILYRYIKHQQS